MKPLLYDKTGTVKLGELNNCIECLVEEERNGLFELSLIYPTSDTLFNLLEKGNIIICNAMLIFYMLFFTMLRSFLFVAMALHRIEKIGIIYIYSN